MKESHRFPQEMALFHFPVCICSRVVFQRRCKELSFPTTKPSLLLCDNKCHADSAGTVERNFDVGGSDCALDVLSGGRKSWYTRTGRLMFWPDKGDIASNLPQKDELINMLDRADVDYFVRHVPKGGIFGWGSEPHKTAHFVVEGMVEIYKLERDGRKKTLYFCKKGDFFGFQILSDSCLPIATACACVDSELIAIPKESFFTAMHTCPEFTDMVVKYLYSLISVLTNETVSSAFYATAQRIPMLLLSLGRDELESREDDCGAEMADGAGEPLIVKYNNSDIANILGISRNSVTSSISRLQEQGIVKKRRNSIEILDIERLERITMLETSE